MPIAHEIHAGWERGYIQRSTAIFGIDHDDCSIHALTAQEIEEMNFTGLAACNLEIA